VSGTGHDGGLAGRSVRLRALTRADMETLRSFINDPAVLRMSNVYRPISDVEQERWFESTVTKPNEVWFGVEVADASLVGTCCLVDIDWIGRSAELRIRIGAKSEWGKSLGTEACSLLVDYGFRHLNLERIWLRVAASNERAVRLYEKVGLVVEGRLRRAWRVAGVVDDVLVMSILRSEWTAPESTSE
jgi:RimJ/RimL family protein N-acetyltransferase